MGGHLGKNIVIAVCLLVAGFLAAWLRFKPYMGTEGVFTDGERTIEIERIEQLRYAVWDEPLPMAGEINSRESERTPTISPDGRYVVFVVGERGLGTDLWIADLDARGAATDPRPLHLLNSVSDEVAPSFSPEGVLLFASNRVGGAGGLDLWRARYDRGVFDAPERFGGNINSPSDDTEPAAVPWTGELVFASTRERGSGTSARGALRDFDLFRARQLPSATDGRVVWDVTPIDEVNTAFDERDPCLSLDGRALLFASDREGGLGDFDLYRATRAPADLKIGGLAVDWLPPQALVGVNSGASERDPRPSADGFTLLFSREDPAGETGWDVWRARSRELVRTPGRPVGWREILVLVALLVLALLAALAKRWRGLEIIYKAFLISLAIHLLMLWWFRDVVPDADPVALREGDGSRVRVRLVEDPNSLSAQRNEARNGELEAARTTIEASAAPERSAASREDQRETETPTPVSQQALERGAAALASAPNRAAAEAAERSAEARAVQAEMRQADESFERLSGAAPAMEVAAAETDAARAQASARDVERAAEAANAAQAALPTPVATAGAPLERSARAARSSDSAPVRRQFLVDRAETFATLDDTGRTPAMDAPTSEFQRLSADDQRATLPMEVAAAQGSSLDARADARPAEASNTRPRGERVDLASGSPSANGPLLSAPLTRSDSAGRPSAPTFVPSAGDGPERRSSDRSIAVVQPAAEGASGRAPSATSLRPFDALVGLDGATGDASAGEPLARATRPPRNTGASEPARVVDSGASRAEPSELQPGAMAPIERSRPSSSPRPAALLRPNAEPSPERVSGAGAVRDVELEGLAEAAVERGPVAADAAENGGARPGAESVSTLELASAGLDEPLRRASQGGGAPGRLPTPRNADAERLDAPKPLTYDVDVAVGPRPESGVAAPERSRNLWDRTPYQSRSGERKIAALEEFGGTEETEHAVASGLSYLAGRQHDDGRWGSRGHDEKYGQTMIGKTGLAALAFMGAGHTPASNTQYSKVVDGALLFLLREQDFGSGHFGDCSSYGHAIATYALGEAYALTKDERLLPALKAGVRQILNNQITSRDPRLDGGWSYYYPTDRRFDRWPRASVSAWQVMALESAKLGGVSVPARVFDRARSFLVHCWDPARGSFRYSHDPARLRLDYAVLPGSTPASMFALSLLGAELDSEQFEPARRFVLERAPKGYRFTGDDDFVFRARGNLYFWYYGTLAMFRVGGDDWRRWNVQMKETLVPAQADDGSWRPISIYAEFAHDTNRDRVYTTAMNVLTLEVYYRYFTPLLKVE